LVGKVKKKKSVEVTSRRQNSKNSSDSTSESGIRKKIKMAQEGIIGRKEKKKGKKK